MRYLKSILVALGISLTILAAVGYYLKPDYKVEKAILIHAPADSVFPYLASLGRWNDWSAWSTKKDPTLKYKLSGIPAGKGSKLHWKGDYTEEGWVEITQLVPGKKIGFIVQTEEQFSSTGVLSVEPQGKTVRVRWVMQGSVGSNIPQRYFLFFMEKFIGSDMDEGLSQLKKICERE